MAVEQPPNPQMQVAFRVDASPRIGGGHVMRCLTLAGRLMENGAAVTFIAAAIADPLRGLLRDAGIRLSEIAPPHGLARDDDWDRASWPEQIQHADAARTAAQLAEARCDWLVVDHYGLDRRWETAMRPHLQRLAVIDDLANRAHNCELLLDQTYGRDEADYRPLTGPDAELLIGARYALLRPEFAHARAAALARHLAPGPVRRIFISLGMTDVGALSEIAARAVLAATDADIDIVLGSAAPTLAAIRAFAAANPRVTLHVDTDQVCALMAAADLAIGAAGSTSWERCCLGLPAVTFVLAANQRVIAARLAESGAIRLLDAPNVDMVGEVIAELSADAEARVRMARACVEICDGEGAARVASRLLMVGRGKWSA